LHQEDEVQLKRRERKQIEMQSIQRNNNTASTTKTTIQLTITHTFINSISFSRIVLNAWKKGKNNSHIIFPKNVLPIKLASHLLARSASR
jgi:hypothetical protein